MSTSFWRNNDCHSLARKISAIFAFVSLFFMLMGCQSEQSSSITNGKEGMQAISKPNQPQELPLEEKEVTNIETFDQLPEDYDSRLRAILREPIPDDVIVSFYYMAAAKSPAPNYRWELHRDGQLFLVRHSGQNLTFEVTFDQPLPLEPTQILSNAEIQALYSQFEQVEFFEQPKLQRHLYAEDGSYVIVRARLGDKFHEVVYENVEGPLVEYLYSITD